MSDQTQTIQNLLTHVSAIGKKYENIAEITGENFNVFKILRFTTNEARTHSAFLAELLNPNGSHSKGKVFLVEFIEMLKTKPLGCTDNNNENFFKSEFNIENRIKVKVEHKIGNTSESEGGYIDILLTDNLQHKIVIENKIYATDQKSQLLRYHKFAPFAPLVYLTLDGRPPSKYSTNYDNGEDCKNDGDNEVEKKVIRISYKTDILEWLQNCKKHTVDLPLLRETLSQYIHLIKYLTGQTMENKEKEELISGIINNKHYLEALVKLSENNLWNETKKNILLKLENQLLGENGIWKDLEMLKESEDPNKDGIPENFWFYKTDWKYCIYFRFGKTFDDISFGIDVIDSKVTFRERSVKDEFKNNMGVCIEDDDWIWKSEFIEYNDMSWYDVTIKGRKLFLDKITEIIKQVGDLMKK